MVCGHLVNGRLVNGRLVTDDWSMDDWSSGLFVKRTIDQGSFRQKDG